MSTITQHEFAFVVAFLLASMTVLTWAVLWSKRSPSVHLWCTAGLLGAAFQVTLVLVSKYVQLPRILEFPLLAALGMGGLAPKAVALHLLTEKPYQKIARLAAWVMLFTAIAAIAFALSPASRVPFSALVLALMLASILMTILVAHRMARHQQLPSARLLSITLLAALIPSLVLYVVNLIQGNDMLEMSLLPVPLYLVGVVATFSVANTGLYIGIVMDLTAQHAAAANLKIARLQEERARLEERTRLVVELHDGFGTQLTSARLNAEQGKMSQAEMCKVLEECIGDLHLVVDTMDNVDGDIGDALRFLRHRLQRRLAGAAIQLHWDVATAAAPALPSTTLLQILRIVQEAISNALQHARASNIWVTAEHDAGHRALRFIVADDGHGFVAVRGEGNGLRNMQGRAARLEAQLQIRDAAPGTIVELTIPLPPLLAN